MITDKTLLITGGCGFVGSNLAVSFKKKYPHLRIICLDNLRRRGSELNISRLKGLGIGFIHGDIRNLEDLELDSDLDLIIECSAEPSVLAGYNQSPAYMLKSNLVGAINCFELARRNKADVIFLSTSRVYPYDAINAIPYTATSTRFVWDKEISHLKGCSANGIAEDFTLEGNKSLYGATKLSAELILREYVSMYEIRAVINRCSVISDMWQFAKTDQGVVAQWLLYHYFKRPLRYIGFGAEGKQVRDVLHIDDLFELICAQIQNIDDINGEVFNVGGGIENSVSLMELTLLCQEITGNRVSITHEPHTRPFDVAIYITDNQKVSNKLGWQPVRSVKQTLQDIFTWAKAKEDDLKEILWA